MDTQTGILVLAAGGSTRLGYPKQLIEWDHNTLIGRMLEVSLKAGASHVGVVLGAHFDTIEKNIKHYPVDIYCNNDWEKGIGSSIKCGLQKMLDKYPETDAVLIILCDQPYLEDHFLRKLILVFKTFKKPIVASHYENTLGVPALFAKGMFPRLLALPDDKGAKPIIYDHLEMVEALYFPYGNVDIDTQEDLNQFKSKEDRNT